MPYGYGYGYYFDPTYLLVLIGVVISLWASAKVKTTYSKYSRVRSMSGSSPEPRWRIRFCGPTASTMCASSMSAAS